MKFWILTGRGEAFWQSLFDDYLPILDINVSFNFAGYIEKPMELL